MKYELKPDETADAAYVRIAGEQGLFGAAFFGHSHPAKRKLAYIWRQLLKQERQRKGEIQ